MSFFPLRMAWREIQATWRHFAYFFLCIAIGVGAIVGLALFGLKLEQTVSREARSIHGGDLVIQLNHPMSSAGMEVLQQLKERGIVSTHVSELAAMATSGSEDKDPNTQLVELKAVASAYPLYGTLRVSPSRPLVELLSRSPPQCRTSPCPSPFGVVVQRSLLIQQGLSLGDSLKIGHTQFMITGEVHSEPDRMANPFSLGPRVIISQLGLETSELIRPGSRVRERYLLQVPPSVPLQPLLYELRGRLEKESPRITTFRNAQPRLKRFLDQLRRYLGLIGLTTLFIGGIGVAMTMYAFIREKLTTIAILKTVGADSAVVVKVYLLQSMVLGLVGCAGGIGIGLLLQKLFPLFLTNYLDPALLDSMAATPLLDAWTLGPVIKGLVMGLGTTVLFASWPLLTIREIRPGIIFRREIAEESPGDGLSGKERGGWLRSFRNRWNPRKDPLRFWTAVVVGGGLTGLAIWQAGSLSTGCIFAVALAVALAALSASAFLGLWVLGKIPTPTSLALRQGIRNIGRPNTQAPAIMISIGLGVMVILTISIMEGVLLAQIIESRPVDAPTFFFIDIQPDQRDEFISVIQREMDGRTPELTPLVRSRLFAVDGEKIRSEDSSEKNHQQGRAGRRRWYQTREYVLTFLADVPKDNEIVEGVWWPSTTSGPDPLVSVEQEAARHLDLHVGSTIDLDIQGTVLHATVSSIRKVDWGNMSTNFYMILSPGSLENAPMTYVGTTKVTPDQEVPLQQAVVRALPNVTAINIGDVLKTFVGVLDRLGLAIRSLAIFCIGAGMVVMAAALTATKYQRLYESVIMKALGATRGLIVRSFGIEYALLGFVAGTIGAILANVLSWGLSYFVFDLPWVFYPEVSGLGILLTIGMCLTIGFFCTFRLLGKPPLAVLRQE